MKTVTVILFVLCSAVCHAQVQQGYYTTADKGVPHVVKIKNGRIYIEAGSETAVYRDAVGKYQLQGYFYGNNESNMRSPVSRNPPYLVLQSSTSYKYCAAGQEKLYRLDDAKTQEFSVLFDPANLEEHDGDVKSEFVDVSLKRVEEIAPNYEKYAKKAKDDPDMAQIWLQVAHATVLISSYKNFDTITLNELLLVKAKYIQRIAPGMKENPCPDVIPEEIWDKAKGKEKE
jgi:hypothetical protein